MSEEAGKSLDDWATTLTKYGLPFATVAIVAAGSVYFSKRMSDLEQNVGAMRRNEVRHLSETDVRMIVQQMAKDGLIHVPQWSREAPALSAHNTPLPHPTASLAPPTPTRSTIQLPPPRPLQRTSSEENAKFEQMATDWKGGAGAPLNPRQ